MTVRRRIDSMSGRIFLILLIGIAAAGALGLSLAERRRVAEVRHIQTVRAIERTAAFLAAFGATPPAHRVREAGEPRFLRRADPGDAPGQHQAGLTDQLRAELPATVTASVASLPVGRCLPRGDGDGGGGADRARRPGLQSGTQAWKSVVAVTDCWRIAARLDDGSTWAFVTGPPALLKADYGLDPVYLAVIAVAAAMLALVVARTAGAPIRRLTLAATRLEADARSSPLAESGPSDVRAAIRAFNEMQQRLARHAVEQTYMIAAITHDLQTPMTRLRLKLEEMDDAVLRERLLSDWHAMRGLVDEGLELARSTSLSEEPVLLDIDSLIHSIVEDEREAGNAATFEVAAGRDWRCRPQMLRRCLQNLVDNAIKYGGAARLSTHVDGRGLRIEVRDPGPGIPADLLEAVFEPMVRLEESRSRTSGGTGLGLTIARNLARRMGASLTIANAPEGGLACMIRFA